MARLDGLQLDQAPDRQGLVRRLVELQPVEASHPTVEIAWTLSALTLDQDSPVADLRQRIARRLIASQPASDAFPHVLGSGRSVFRSHVCCFADLVYPVQALSLFATRTADAPARQAALRGAELMMRRQGSEGQWWWHYDVRTGAVIEGYPVYAVHQDSMAPMALLAAQEATGVDVSGAIQLGLRWLESSPELRGGSLIDGEAGLIWRKVARREPRKLSRGLQAAASRVHPSLRVPGLGRLLPPVAIDHEDRPYHLGWLLHAFPSARTAGVD